MMEHILLPTTIEYQKGKKENETIVTIEPLYSGYGLTVGNALRRVLLSSLSGGAVTAVKIKGAEHEFSTLPYIKEDVVDMILNIKKLRFNVFTDEEVRVTLKAKGEKIVTGADIEGTSEVEVANPDAYVCTLTNRNAQLDMELFIRKGRGYLPTEQREREKRELGTIMVDALFTPIRNVGLTIENVRVGQMTNYNKVVLALQTDGSITAQDAMKQACSILIEQFSMLVGKKPQAEMKEDQPAIIEAVSEEVNDEEDATETESEEGEDQKKKRGRPKKN